MYDLNTKKPDVGEAVLVEYSSETENGTVWNKEVAFYCDGNFYTLRYDENLGVLRKHFISDPVTSWSTIT